MRRLLAFATLLVAGSLPATEEYHADVSDQLTCLLGSPFPGHDRTALLSPPPTPKQWPDFSKIPATSAAVYPAAKPRRDTTKTVFRAPVFVVCLPQSSKPPLFPTTTTTDLCSTSTIALRCRNPPEVQQLRRIFSLRSSSQGQRDPPSL
ncbi:hypothetical protein IW262DRAFT_1372641 [Armillaria fumosa]|nr:hypothetical protein IW262DRAFT_1372641 [Armillaria fumosa]